VYATRVGFYNVAVEQSQLKKCVSFCDEAKYMNARTSNRHSANGAVLQQSSSSHCKQFTTSLFDERALWSNELRPFSTDDKQQAVTYIYIGGTATCSEDVTFQARIFTQHTSDIPHLNQQVTTV